MSRRADIWRTSWDAARRRRVYRVDVLDGKRKLLDPGVRWFVLALESLGARTRHSCDGHGRAIDWYVTFAGPLDLAERVAMLDARLAVRLCPSPALESPFWELRFAPWLFLDLGGAETLQEPRLEHGWQKMQEWTVANWCRNRRAQVDRTLRLRRSFEGRRER